MIKLDNCKHCGSQAKLLVYPEGGVAVVCTYAACKMQTPVLVDHIEDDGKTPGAVERVVRIWNQRVNNAAKIIGHWERSEGSQYPYCSACGCESLSRVDRPYCQFCGANMDGGQDDGH